MYRKFSLGHTERIVISAVMVSAFRHTHLLSMLCVCTRAMAYTIGLQHSTA